MDEARLLSPSSLSRKTACSPSNTNNFRQRFDTTTVIQQSDVSSSRPAVLAHDALGPLLFEALDGFFFTINHNFELDFVSDNVAQYLKFSQEELSGRNLHQCVHPNDVPEFSKAWAKKDSGDNLANIINGDQNNAQSLRGCTFLCRMRMNDELTPYCRMTISVALHRDSSGSDKTFLICIARRPPSNDPKEKPSILGFDQFSSRINLHFDIESLDTSHMKSEIIDPNHTGKNFRDCVHSNDVKSIERHFQEVIEDGEAKSSIYRFRLHDDVYAFISTRSKLFSNSFTGKSDSILSTHTIVRLIENTNDLNGNACTRLTKSIISSNRDLQRHRASHSNKNMTNSSSTPIGTQFALAMLGMHKNASNSLQQHVSSTLGTLMQMQSSFATPNQSSPNDKSQMAQSMDSPSTSQNRSIAQKMTLIDNVSSSDTVDFGNKQKPMSPSLESIHSNPNPSASPLDSLDMFLPSSTPTPINSNDVNFFLSSPAPTKSSSGIFNGNELFSTMNNSKSAGSSSILPSQTRSSTRLRQLLTNKSPSTNENPSQTLHYHPDDLLQEPESPSSTRLSPMFSDISSPMKQYRKQNSNSNEQNQSADLLLKQILGKSNSRSTSPIRTESIHSDDSSSNGQTSNKQRSDTYLRTLLNDEVRPQKVLVEAPFVYGTRSKLHHQTSQENPKQNSNSLKTQLSLQIQSNQNNEIWANKSKKKQRQHSNSFGSQNSSVPRKPGRPKRDPSEYLLAAPGCQTPQSIVSDGSLDVLLDPTINNETIHLQNSPLGLRRSAQISSAMNGSHNSKRSVDLDDSSQTRKYPRLLTQALRDNVKVEYPDHLLNSPSKTLGAIRSGHQSLHATIKSEPEIFDDLLYNTKTTSLPTQNSRMNSSSNMSADNNQPSTLRSLIQGSQTPTVPVNKDTPLYDLLQNLESNNSNETSLCSSSLINSNSIDPLEQYLTPVLSQTSSIGSLPAKDDYLVSLLSSDPQKPSELTIIQPQQNRTSSENTRSSMISYDSSHGMNNTNSTSTTTLQNNSTLMAANNQSNDDFLVLLDNKEFLECLNESSAIDSILAQNSTSVIEPIFPTSNNKRSEKDEKAISEIYKKLVNSLNPGTNQQTPLTSTTPMSASHNLDQLPLANSPYHFMSGDFFSTENTQPYPPNRTVTQDTAGTTAYRQTPGQLTKTSSYSSNNNQFSDCFSLDLLDTGTYPPNVTLSPMNTNFLPPTPAPTGTTPMLNNSPMMMYPSTTQSVPNQGPPTTQQIHSQPHAQPNTAYRSVQSMPGSPYNNFIATPPNQMGPGYYSMNSQQGMSPVNPHQSPSNKRSTFMHQQTTLQHRPMVPTNAQPQQPQQPQHPQQQHLQQHQTQQQAQTPHHQHHQQQHHPQQHHPQQHQQQQQHHQQHHQQQHHPQHHQHHHHHHHQQQQQHHLQQQQQQQQQLQLHMSMNVTLPQMGSNQQQSQQHPSVPATMPTMGQQQQTMNHRQPMNNYNDYMMANNGALIQSDYQQHQYSTNNQVDLGYGNEIFMQSPAPMNQTQMTPRHMNMISQQTSHHSQSPMHQTYPNMSVALSATIQQNSHNSNGLMNSSVHQTSSTECRQPDEITNHMMNCLSFQPAHCNREFVRKQLQTAIHSRQKPVTGKDITGASGMNSMGTPLDSNQKGAYFRSQLSSQMSTPPLPNTLRTQATLQHPGKPT